MYNFECDDIASVDKLGTEDAAECNSASNSVSDRVCAPTHTVVGYMGGDGDYPNYDTNYTQLNYSETLRLLYDPAQTNFSRVLDAYWKYAPAPTISQPDPAYMLRIFTTTPAQAAAAAASKAALEKQYNTTVYLGLYDAADYTFWKAEEYHQQYDFKAGMTCNANHHR